MRFDVVTLFPELFLPHLRCGVTRRAFELIGGAPGSGDVPAALGEPAVPAAGPVPEDRPTTPPAEIGVGAAGEGAGSVRVRLWPLRDFAEGTYRRVDDRPFGGGPGMVMLAEPLLRALAAVRAARSGEGADSAVAGPLAVVHFTPTGRRLDQALVQEFAAGPGAVLVCGRYEGVDQRFVDHAVTHEISLGDFVLSGGELPALALLDAVARLQPGVLQPDSAAQDSFAADDGLLEGPRYSRPEVLWIDGQARAVPAVLRGGHHGRIARHERQAALALTARRRPDLIEAARRRGALDAQDESFLRSLVL